MSDIDTLIGIGAWKRAEELADAETRTVAGLHASALWYAEQGLAVFPLTPGSKVPFPRSRGCKDATTDSEQVTAWWTAQPEANIGLATGGLVDVVDIDGPAGQRSRLAHWCDACDAPICDHEGPGSRFVTIERACVGKVHTPRGMHLYVPAQPGETNRAGIFPGVDYRASGGYVVAPPSRTPDGTYTWSAPINLDTIERVS